ncbi:MAG: hypothetical protein R3B95_07650 [Nitrospirales bacterium]|nr:hypothetical protein [Nitrospirales bacterium]
MLREMWTPEREISYELAGEVGGKASALLIVPKERAERFEYREKRTT